MKITFDNISTLGHVLFENNQYIHIHYPEMLVRYDSNFIEFKQIPSLSEFQNAETYLRDLHLKNGQKHIKFYFPPNEKLSAELIDYLNQTEYNIGFLELYGIQPQQFPAVKETPDIEIQIVTEENLKPFLLLQFQHDLEFGIEFANQRQELHKQNSKDQNIQQLFALYKGEPAGSVDVIISEKTAEIDGLVVDEDYQRRGIGSRLQKFVMDNFQNKTIILVADGEDSPRDMYRRQNYQYQGYKYHALKVYED